MEMSHWRVHRECTLAPIKLSQQLIANNHFISQQDLASATVHDHFHPLHSLTLIH